MIVEDRIEATQAVLRSWRLARHTVALVPTMGYFHAGHLALMKKASEIADKVVVSLFVNPAQFGPSEDLAVYPRDFEGDSRKAEETGADLLFCPDAETIYPPGHDTSVQVNDLSSGLCGKDRPGHFRGVTTVVAKLFNIIQPDYAIFGEKDFQQLMVIKRMVRDLDFPVSIVGHPTVREADGMAMSSRNAYLSEQERGAARILYQALIMTRDTVFGSTSVIGAAELVSRARDYIDAEQSCSLEYFNIVREDTLTECDVVTEGCRAVGAIRVNKKIRLIDNIALY